MKDLLYIQKLRTLLQMEHDSEKEEYRKQMHEMGLGRRIKRGLCWYPVSVGRSYYNSLNQLVVEIFNTPSTSCEGEVEEEIEHNFEYGKPVCFFSPTPALPPRGGSQRNDYAVGNINTRSNPIDNLSPIGGEAGVGLGAVCSISYVDGNRMVVQVPSAKAVMDLQNAELLGVQLYFDETSYKTMFHALDEVLKAKNSRVAHLRSVFSGGVKPAKWTFDAMKFPWLNASQEKAVNEVLWSKDVAVVHGPPGTGKTTTLVEAIYETLRRETQVLVCAQSNMAVDWISEKLVDHGVPVLRIGNPTRVNDKMLSYTYERKFESHPDYPELWNIRRSIRQIREQKKKGDSTHQKLARLRERADEIEYRIKASLFTEARVVACTLVGADNRLLIGQKFPTLFIDEAAQALEPACWIAIRRAGRVVLAGDHMQLPPTVKCYEALKQGLGVTLMERIVQNVPDCVTMLKMQYRMHEQIMKFSSHWFYEDGVVSADMVKNRSILDLDVPITWVSPTPALPLGGGSHTNDSALGKSGSLSNSIDNLSSPGEKAREGLFLEEYVGENHGRINKTEAELAIKTLEDYVTTIGKERFLDERMDIGLISPYRMQIQYLRSLVKKSQILKPIKRYITINTIDGFQGQERDIIMISLVRSNEKGEIGFLRDLRRMNVAMTRARMKLFILGDPETLSKNPFYRDLKKYIDNLK
ncbi:MAG: AAA domain-containing protein [Bacteroidaceae bacterium]|nr:AAA domain-containing protein [Bacteroidaceae bacterium]